MSVRATSRANRINYSWSKKRYILTLGSSVGGGSAATLGWSALVADAVDYEITLQDVGSGTPAITRGTAQSALMGTGYYHEFPADEASYQGRGVTNEQPISHPLDASAVTFGDITPTTGKTDPFGGTDAVEWLANSALQTVVKTITPAFIGGNYINSIWLRLESGNGAIRISNPSGSWGFTGSVTSEWKRYTTSSITGNPGSFTIRITNAGDKIQAYGMMREHSTNNVLDTTTPSEYVPTTGSVASKTFSTTNGNTVASNVVTEGTGTELTTWGTRIAPDHTNFLTYSRDLTNAAWTATNMTTAYTSTGLKGVASTATRLTATAGNATVIRAAAETHVSASQATAWWLKRITGTGTVELTLDNGSTWQDITSSLTANYTIIPIDQTVANPQIGIRIVTSADAVDVGNVTGVTNFTLEQIDNIDPIFTTSAPLGTDPQTSEWADANFTGSSDFAISFELEGNDQGGTVEANYILTTATGTINFVYVDGSGNLTIEDTGAAKATKALSAGLSKCGVFKEGGFLGVTVGGTTGTLVASSNNVGGAGTVQVGEGVTSPILIKNIKGYTGGSLQTQMENNTA